MLGKTVLLTGASGGIGLATAQGLAERGAQVVMVCRNPVKAEAALVAVKKAAHPDALAPEMLLADLSLLSNVQRLAGEVTRRFNKLDVLLNNAGIMSGNHSVTPEGHELSWVTNHLSAFALTNSLLPLLEAAGRARIITVASEAHWLGKLEPRQEVRNDPENYNAIAAYCDSKLANILFTKELAHRLASTPVTANCLHPGMVNTGLVQADTPLLMKSMWWMALPFMISPRQGARTSLFLASAPEAAGISGRYFKNSRPGRSSGKANSQSLARQLWQISSVEANLT